MLISLRLQNIALFGSIEIDFQKGFTAFTGETGSGKSIFIDTLNALLPYKKTVLNNSFVEKGSLFSSVEGVFSVLPSIKNWLTSHEFDVDEELIISREWRLKENKYKSRFRVNGVIMSREQISNLRSLLLDLTLQGDAFTFSDSTRQLNLLDSLASNKVQELSLKVKNEWKSWTSCQLKLKEAAEKITNANNIYKEMQYIYDDLEKLDLNDIDEDKNLEIVENRLSNLLRLKNGVNSLLSRLNESLDEYPSLLDHTNFCINELRSLSKLDPSLENIFQNFSNLTNNFYDIIFQIKEYEKTLEVDPNYLSDLQYRLTNLKLYQKKYERNLPDLIQYKNELSRDLSLHYNSDSIDELVSLEKTKRINIDKLNKELSSLRKIIALEFQSKLIKSLKELGIPNVRFEVSFEETEPTIYGIDRVNFLFSANPGFPMAPLSEIASGGEKSRILLAIKAIFASFDQTTLLIFDEIDSGVSGSVSSSLANMLSKLSKYRQVFCVTHQPLIAAFADNHFVFKKNIISGQTFSTLSHLEEIADRQKELASMAGGEIIEANAYAASLLEHKAA